MKRGQLWNRDPADAVGTIAAATVPEINPAVNHLNTFHLLLCLHAPLPAKPMDPSNGDGDGGLGKGWVSTVANVMDAKARYGGVDLALRNERGVANAPVRY